MNNLKEELDKYWEWAGISPQEYSIGKTPEYTVQSEWEDDYPSWRQLDNEIDNAIEDLSKNWNSRLAELIVLTIALDNENGLIFDKCFEKTDYRDKIIELCCESEQPFARMEIAERYNTLRIPAHLQIKLENDIDGRIRKILLREINNLNR
jgi:hypothetical protein